MGDKYEVDSQGLIRPVMLASDPSGVTEGFFYYNTVSQLYRFYDGAVWHDIDTDTQSLQQVTAVGNVTTIDIIMNGSAMKFGLDDTVKMERVGADLRLTAAGVSVDVTELDTHVNDSTIHFTEGSIDHVNILSIGVKTHAEIDTHIGDSTLHYTEASISHLNIGDIGTTSHVNLDIHVGDSTIH